MSQTAVTSRPWIEPRELFREWCTRPHCVWLDSAQTDAPTSGTRYSVLAAAPSAVLSCRGRQIEWLAATGVTQTEADLFDLLERELARRHCDDPHPFPVGAAIGYFGYDLKNLIENLPVATGDDLLLPHCWFGFYDELCVFDHAEKKVWEVNARNRASETRGTPRPCSTSPSGRGVADSGFRFPVSAPSSPPPEGSGVGSVSLTDNLAAISSNFTRAAYLEAVARAKQYIAAGDIYQVNLSQRFQCPWSTPPDELYLALRAANPAPYCAYLDLGEAQVLSSSPECFLQISDRTVVTRPIKGTRPRGATTAADEQFARELIASPKDNAELLMITDLERNDLGRVCRFGSVHVRDLVSLERYATVMHLVATVAGQLRPEVSHVQCVRACFPGGSITGAPKIRAMQIIAELEPHARGVYTGAIGFLGFNGVSHLNIAIRTIVQQRGQLTFHAGGGIVADSDPDAEYEETIAKARGILNAINYSRLRQRPALA